jgi:hypothetical protein
MSICVTESFESRRMWEEICRRDDEQQRLKEAEAELAEQFEKAIEAGEPDATPAWAGTVLDYKEARRLGMNSGDKGAPRRAYTVAECLRDSLDYSNGPGMEDVLRLFSLAMKSSDPAVSKAARFLVVTAAAKWAEHNFDSEAS